MGSLYSFQQETVETVLRAPLNRWVVNYDTGLGKTAVAVSVASRLAAGRPGPLRTLVVTPSIVKQHWVGEFKNWWPEYPEDIGVLSMGRGRKNLSKPAAQRLATAYGRDIRVVSHALLDEVEDGPYDLVIFDESHRFKNPKSKQSREARRIMRANPQAAALNLSATPMPDNVRDIWHQLDLLWPGRFGASKDYRYPSWAFDERYSNRVPNEYSPLGFDWKGLNKLYAPELAARLSAVSTHITKDAVAHLLPPFMVSVLKVESDKQVRFNNLDEWLQGQGKVKEPFVRDWLEDAQESATHLCILTHLKETGRKITEWAGVNGDRPVIYIDGDMPPEVRNAELARAKAMPKATVVATMHSIGIGIDLTFCTQALFAELYWRPETVIQALGRFSRLSGRVPSSVVILVLMGTDDERVAQVVSHKMKEINGVQGTSAIEQRFMSEVAASVTMTDEEALAQLNLAAASFMEEAYA